MRARNHSEPGREEGQSQRKRESKTMAGAYRVWPQSNQSLRVGNKVDGMGELHKFEVSRVTIKMGGTVPTGRVGRKNEA